MNQYIDIYCERTEPGLWAEPINAVTNLSFILAAIFAFFLMKREKATNDWNAWVLVFLTAAMGIGSTLFHTFAVRWSALADVLPILLYQIFFIYAYSHQVMTLPKRGSLALLFAFFVAIFGFGMLPSAWMNGSLQYLPALFFLTGFAVWHYHHANHERYGLALTALVFVTSLTFRSIDMSVCDHFTHGTHFLWHCLNGLVLYLSTRSYVLNRQ